MSGEPAWIAELPHDLPGAVSSTRPPGGPMGRPARPVGMDYPSTGGLGRWMVFASSVQAERVSLRSLGVRLSPQERALRRPPPLQACLDPVEAPPPGRGKRRVVTPEPRSRNRDGG